MINIWPAAFLYLEWKRLYSFKSNIEFKTFYEVFAWLYFWYASMPILILDWITSEEESERFIRESLGRLTASAFLFFTPFSHYASTHLKSQNNASLLHFTLSGKPKKSIGGLDEILTRISSCCSLLRMSIWIAKINRKENPKLLPWSNLTVNHITCEDKQLVHMLVNLAALINRFNFQAYRELILYAFANVLKKWNIHFLHLHHHQLFTLAVLTSLEKEDKVITKLLSDTKAL